MKKEVKEFIKYVKKEFNQEIILKPSSTPDTFESIFGTNSIEKKNSLTNKNNKILNK